ncbi:MAG: phosphatase domain-containing protein [Pseudobdellovibrionaceae bacterium]
MNTFILAYIFSVSLSVYNSALAKEASSPGADNVKVFVISDIDDTIEKSHIRGGLPSKVGHVVNYHDGFFGMAPLYRALADNGVSVVYVSGMPTFINDLTKGATEFLAAEGFPGEYILRQSLEEDTYSFKVKTITGYLEELKQKEPNKTFHVIAPGDNGEQDIRVLDTVSKRFPDIKFDIYIHKIYEKGVLKILPEQKPFFTAADLALQIFNSKVNLEQHILNESQMDEVFSQVQIGLNDPDPETRSLVLPNWAELTSDDQKSIISIMATVPSKQVGTNKKILAAILRRFKEIGTTQKTLEQFQGIFN